MFKSIISFMFIHLVSRIAVPKKNYKTIAVKVQFKETRNKYFILN